MAEYVETYDQQRRNQITLENVMTIVNMKILEPDSIDEFIEAAKIFDHDNDGKIEVAELRYAMSILGDPLDEGTVDDLIGELDREKTGLIEIVEWARITFKWGTILIAFISIALESNTFIYIFTTQLFEAYQFLYIYKRYFTS